MSVPRLNSLIWPATLVASFLIGAAGGVIAARHHVAVVAQQDSVLDSPIADVDLNSPTLEELARLIDQRRAVPLRVDWPGLAKRGISPATYFSCIVRAKRTTVRQLLSLCFSSNPSVNVFANVVTRDGVICVTNSDEDSPEFLGPSDVADILPAAAPASAPDWPPPGEHFLISVAQAAASRDPWAQSAGIGDCSIFGHELIALQSVDQQVSVAAFLNRLRAVPNSRQSSIHRLPHLSFEADPLDRKLPAEDFRGASVAQALERLRDQTGVDILVDWPELQFYCRTGPTSPVAGVLPAGRLADAVRKICGADISDVVGVFSTNGIVVVSATKFTLDEIAARFYPFEDTPEHRRQLPQHVNSERREIWPGWLVVRADPTAQNAVASWLKAERRP